MPKISELRESKYIKKEDCPLSLTISRVERENVGMEGQTEMKWVLYFNEIDKGLIMNITNGEILYENFGTDEMFDWIGKRVDLYHEKNVKYGTKKVGGVRVVSANQPTAPRKSVPLSQAKAVEDEEIPF